MSEPFDLPGDVWEKLRVLESELDEGLITLKGFEKKKANLLSPFQTSNAGSDESRRREFASLPDLPTDDAPATPVHATSFDLTETRSVNVNIRAEDGNVGDEEIDLDPEPSAADVVDFLDYLPSPTHSPTRTEGAALMEANHQRFKPQRPPGTPMHSEASRPPTQPFMPARPQFHPHPNMDPYRPIPPQPQQHQQPPPHWMMRPNRPAAPYGPYPGHQRPPVPYYRPGPHLPHSGAPPYPRPMYRPGLPPPPVNGYGTLRPMSAGPGQPQNPRPPYPITQHKRTPSMESKRSHILGNNILPPRQSTDIMSEPVMAGARQGRSDADWDTASVNGSWSISNGRDPTMTSSPVRLQSSRSTGSNFSAARRSQSSSIRRSGSLGRGRSRYGDSYMATSFKAIEPAPQPKLLLDDPVEQQFLAELAGRQMLPLKPREILFDPIDSVTQANLTEFNSLADVLRFRATNESTRASVAFTNVDARGKEPVSLTWDKLNARAEKVAHMIRDKSNLRSGDRVALIYRKSEVLEYAIALFGCFLAGMVAIPINAAEDLSELSFILNLTNTYLILTTDYNLRVFTKDMQARSIEFPPNIEWWKTNDFGSWYPSKKASGYPPIKLTEIAYIEYAKAGNGELKGVTVTHEAIMQECKMIKAAVTESTTARNDDGAPVVKLVNDRQPVDTVISYLEPRQQIGMVLSVLASVYSGSHTVFTSSSVVDSPASWVYILSKYKATIAFADYDSLDHITKYFEANPKEVRTHSKKVAADLSTLRLLMVDTIVVNPELNEYIADKLLRPLGCSDNPSEVVCPVISLAEHGGMILAMRDYLGPVELEGGSVQGFSEDGPDSDDIKKGGRPVFATGSSRSVWECLLDAEALKINKVVVVAAGDEARRLAAQGESGKMMVGSFGFAIPGATLAIVNPETTTLCPADTIGEVWIDAPSMSGGFWALPKHSEAIFHAKPIVVSPETFYPELYQQEFVRTGLVGTLIGGRLVVFGSYEDRIRQQKASESFGFEETYFTSDITYTLRKRMGLHRTTVFEVCVNDQHLPVVACESGMARAELPGLAADIDNILIETHGLRAYSVVITSAEALPRHWKHGRCVVHALMAKRAFMAGQLKIRHVKMDVDRTVFNLAVSEGGSQEFWRSSLAYEKAAQTGSIQPLPHHQHTGMETVREVIDEQTAFDLTKFTNIVDILQWRTTLYPEDTAFIHASYSSGATHHKPYTWKKMNYKIAAVATYLMKKGFKSNRRALVVVPFGVDWILALYACLVIGVTPVPIEPPDPHQQAQRVGQDVESLVAAIHDLGISYVIVNPQSEDILRHKLVTDALKKTLGKGAKLPEFTNVSKASKSHKLLGKESGLMIRSEWNDSHATVLIAVEVSADDRQTYACLSHETILHRCRAQKTTCQMKQPNNIVATGLGGCHGLVLLHAAFCGVYVGCRTVLIPTSDFYMNPISFFEELVQNKGKDVCASNPMIQYAMNRMNAGDQRLRHSLQKVQNVMLTTEGRPRPLLYQHIAKYFAQYRLEKEAINTVYSHHCNPMITTRSYMLLEPITLIIDSFWLRQGIIRAVAQEEDAIGRAVVLHDSGIVPSNTMVAIVNPETRRLCASHQLGEIWVASDCNALTLAGLDENAHAARFGATITGADSPIQYMRTGDLGFLWNVRRQFNMMHQEEGQCLFVLGSMNDAIERNGLHHFPFDIELSIERCHPAIPPGGSIVLGVESDIVAIVAVKSKENALPVIPLVVSSVLENHSFLVDRVVIVQSGHFPRSRYGDKQRSKALASYVEGKLSTLCVKRITHQNEPLNATQWSQSQVSLDETISVSAKALSIRSPSVAETEEGHSR